MKQLSLILRVLLLLLLFGTLLPQPAQAAAPAQAVAPAGHKPPSCRYVHIYMKGEPLSLIARYYGITPDALRAANPWLDFKRLKDGDLLCIPQVRFEIIHPKAKMQAYINLGRLTVQGQNFAQYDEFFVRVREKQSNTWIKVGLLRVPRKGSFTEYFKLPKEIRSGRYFEVCLKETTRNYVTCTTVDNRWKPETWWRSTSAEAD